MKHNHWDIYKCTYCLEQEAPTDEGLHSEYVQLQSTVEDLLNSLETQKKSNEEFVRVEHCGIKEVPAGFNLHIRRLKNLVGWKEQK